MKGKSTGFWLKLVGDPLRKRLENHEKITCVYGGGYMFMKGRSRCWCLELYHVPVADVLSCITLLLLMSWAVSRFCCWCLELYHVSVADVLSCSWLELYHAFVADVLSCIALLLLMSWAVSRFCCGCLELCQFAIGVCAILFIVVCFSICSWNKKKFRV